MEISQLFVHVKALPPAAQAFLILSLVVAPGHLFTARRQPHPVSVVVKGLACGLLVPFVVLSLGFEKGWLLAAALLACTAGDVFLALEEKGFFQHGLIAFLAGHLLYVALFLNGFQPAVPDPVRWVVIILAPALAIGLGRWMWPGLGKLRIPVAFYIAAITTMTLTAAFSAFPANLVLLGAILFMVSDSILAVNRFKMPLAFSGPSVWATYYSAQLLITLGVIASKVTSS